MFASLCAGGAAGVDVKVGCEARVKSACVSCGVEVSHCSDPAIGYDLFPAIFAYHKLFDELSLRVSSHHAL